jgi:hypothetical protein
VQTTSVQHHKEQRINSLLIFLIWSSEKETT